jgi:hypothetical protein
LKLRILHAATDRIGAADWLIVYLRLKSQVLTLFVTESVHQFFRELKANLYCVISLGLNAGNR